MSQTRTLRSSGADILDPPPMHVDDDDDDDESDIDDEDDSDEEFQGQSDQTAEQLEQAEEHYTQAASAAGDLVVQRIEPSLGADRVGTVRILTRQPSCVRLVLGTASGDGGGGGGSVLVRGSFFVQPELWPGRQIGEWTAQEHQQLAHGLTTYGRDWARLQRMMVPSRSARELELYTLQHLADRKPPPPLVPPPPKPTHLLGRGGLLDFPGRPLRGPGSRGGRGSYGRRGARGGGTPPARPGFSGASLGAGGRVLAPVDHVAAAKAAQAAEAAAARMETVGFKNKMYEAHQESTADGSDSSRIGPQQPQQPYGGSRAAFSDCGSAAPAPAGGGATSAGWIVPPAGTAMPLPSADCAADARAVAAAALVSFDTSFDTRPAAADGGSNGGGGGDGSQELPGSTSPMPQEDLDDDAAPLPHPAAVTDDQEEDQMEQASTATKRAARPKGGSSSREPPKKRGRA